MRNPIIGHDFVLDEFQVRAIEAIDSDQNVLVAAPTGSGKTVVAEAAVTAAIRSGRRCFYTAPIKALSNQKFNDLRESLGEGQVGLLTGDHSINSTAPVVVMTTEVLRNMVYGESPALDDLGWVVLDEVHFLADAYRGPVWEEVLIHTPNEVRFVALSATVSNAGELGDWITSLRGPTVTVVEERRPVQLDSMLLVGDRNTDEELLVPLVVNGKTNPQGRRFDVDRGSQNPGQRYRSRYYTPRRTSVVDLLDKHQMLPAIYFIFSRNGCDEAAQRCLAAGFELTTEAEREQIRTIASSKVAQLGESDRQALGYETWLRTLLSGVAAHHAGMVPTFRETVELCFVEGLIKVVFATETLAMGINMPARSVAIEKLSKFNGETHEPLTPSLYTQLTGRAGRRGIDTQGHAVVLWSPFAVFDHVAELATSREFTLESSFRPNYNMAANLVARYDRDRAFEVLGLSFAQFQADRIVHGLKVEREKLRQQVTEADHVVVSPTEMALDVAGYKELLDAIEAQKRERRRARFDTDRFLSALKPGDVLEISDGPDSARSVVVSVSTRRGGAVQVASVDTGGQRIQITSDKDWAFASVIGHIDLPVPYVPKDREFRKEAARRLRRVNTKKLRPPRREHSRRSGTSSSGLNLRSRLGEHPLHDHPERERLLEQLRAQQRSHRDLHHVEDRIKRVGVTLATRLDAILDVLDETGHVDNWHLTDAGVRLQRIYHESDLLISMAVGEGLFDNLDGPETAALASCFSFEHRSSTAPPEPVIPTVTLRERYPKVLKLWNDLGRIESSRSLSPTREPQGGFMSAAWSWASGQDLGLIIDDDLSGGDFVRNIRQLIDLLEQISQVLDSPSTARTTRSAAESLRRGVIMNLGGPQ